MSLLVGKIVLDIDAGAPNNGRGLDNVGKVKALRVGRDVHPYVSAQAFRRWLRDTIAAAEPASPVTRSGSGAKQQAYTGGRPDQFLDDDLFGYMVALKGANTQRDTVLATGTLVSVTPQRPDSDFGTMSRGFPAEANPVLHEHEHYTADLAGDLLLDLPRVGVFETDGSGLKVNLVGAAIKEAHRRAAAPCRRSVPCSVRFARRRQAVRALRRPYTGIDRPGADEGRCQPVYPFRGGA